MHLVKLQFLSYGVYGCTYDVIHSVSSTAGIPLPAIAKTVNPSNPSQQKFSKTEIMALEEVRYLPALRSVS